MQAKRDIVLEALFERTRRADPWDALGLPRGASDEQIREGYFAAMEQLAPLRQSETLSPGERDKSVQVVLRLDEAYHSLLSRRRGSVPAAAMIERDPGTGTHAIRVKPEQPMALVRGQEAFRRGANAEARAWFAEVVMAHPELPDGHFWFARASLGLGSSPAKVDRKTVERAFRKALELSPNHVEYLLTFARYWRALGDRQEAVRFYARARALIPEHPEAELEMRRLAEPEAR